MTTHYDDYHERFRHVAMTRTDGVLELRLHSDGGPLVWGSAPHEELGHCFATVGADPENRVIILTGTAGEFIKRLDDSWVGAMTPEKWDRIFWNGRRLLMNLLDVEVPMIAAVNGPAHVHPELAALCDIVIAAADATFQDAPHFRHGTVPGDGSHIVWPALLGPNRGRYFLLMSQRLSATEAQDLGVVAEVVEPEALADRAHEIARELATRPDITLRYTRAALIDDLRRKLSDGLGYGLALEGLGAYGSWPT